MHVKAKSMAFGGLLLAVSVICMSLGSVIETNTLFLLAAASYFVGIVIREYGLKMRGPPFIWQMFAGSLVAPNKIYVLSFAAMGFLYFGSGMYLACAGKHPNIEKRHILFWVMKYVIFNVMYIPMVLVFQELLFSKAIPGSMLLIVIAAGQGRSMGL